MTYNSDQDAMDGEFYGHAAVGFRGRVSDLIRLLRIKDFWAEGKKEHHPNQ